MTNKTPSFSQTSHANNNDNIINGSIEGGDGFKAKTMEANKPN